jgi:subtilisin family serine protease
VVHGVSVLLTAREASAVATLPGVRLVIEDYDLQLATDAGPVWIGAPGVWDGSATASVGGTRGEGVIVGSIDSGINLDHPSFADPGPDGYDHINPLGPGVFTGWCDPSNIPPGGNPGPWICNDKLVGAWDYTDAYCASTGLCSEADGPEDDHSHGSLTAGTAVGNVTPVYGMSGVAPHAALITYDACYTENFFGGVCPLVNLVAAVDQSILDGVDVITFSIVGGTNPWSPEDIDSFFLAAVEAGTLVSAAAGNDGPGTGVVLHRGPWVMTTGATTHHRTAVANQLVDFAGGPGQLPDLTGQSRTGGYGPAPIVHAGDFPVVTNASRCGDWLEAFPEGTWIQGEIVVCDQGDIPEAIKCFNVLQGGAGGCVVANLHEGVETQADPHVIPATHLASDAGDSLRAWLASGTGHTARITAGQQVLDPPSADVMADFSSRGPSSIDVIKPELVAPGVEIFAAARDGFVGFWAGQPEIPGLVVNEYGHFRGTSLSTPHASGSAALLRALFPTLSPAEIKSLLMLTARPDGVAVSPGGPPADLFDMGAGRIDLTRAARAGLVLDETGVNYHAANPAAGGQPKTLNLASLMDSQCISSCGWSRTVRNVWTSAVTWSLTAQAPTDVDISITPDQIILSPGESTTIQVDASFTVPPLPGEWRMATLTLPPDDPDVAETHMPILVRSGPGVFADGFESGDTSAWSVVQP